MTPKPESETDPWKAIQRYEFVQTNFAYTTDHEMERDAEGEWARWEAVDAARAAEAAQHQQEIAALKKQVSGLSMECARRAEVIAAVEAERDQKTAEVETLRGVGCNEDGDGPCGACLKCARAERDRLKAALERLRDCDWTIGRGDRMDAVRDIARAALTPQGQSTDGETR